MLLCDRLIYDLNIGIVIKTSTGYLSKKKQEMT